jgi:nucleotide-binding universal stress UspA family protein
MTQRIERVVLPLDAAADCATAIDTAARLASRWRVPLHAVFVEDEELLHLAGLPFARQVSLLAGGEALTRQHVEDHLRAAAERARGELAAAAARHRIEFSFEIVRGPPAGADLGDGEHDFVVAGAATRPIGQHFRVPSRGWYWRGLVHALLLSRRDWHRGGSVLTVLRRRGPEAERMLDLAAQIAGFGSGALDVLAAPDPAGASDFRGWVRGVLAGYKLTIATEQTPIDAAALSRRLAAADCRLVVLDEAHDDLRDCLAQAECDVLVVRTPR